MELNTKDEAMKKALILIANKKNKEQKCCIFGEKIGNWDNLEGTVISITREEEAYPWYFLRVFKSIESFNNWDLSFDGVERTHGSSNSDRYVFLLGETFVEELMSNFVRKDIDTRLAYDQFKKYFENFYDNWTGEENSNSDRAVIAMIGSTRFQDTFIDKCWEFSALGYVVSLPNFRPANKMAKGFDIPEDILEDIGFKRIAKADKVYVVNEDGYIGDSTRKEITYAKSIGKNIKYMEEQ